MRNKTVLLTSVSAVAMATAATSAQAQTVPDGFTVSLEGGALFRSNEAVQDKLGISESAGLAVPLLLGSGGSVANDVNENIGWRAAIAVGKQIDPLWDIKLGLALNHQFATSSSLDFSFEDIPSAGSGFSYSGLFEINNDFDYETADLEIGFRPEGTYNMRLFGGVRGLHYTDSFDKLGDFGGTEYLNGSAGSGGSVSYASLGSGEFWGAGPRIGMEGSTRIGDSIFGISGSASAALLFGVARNVSDISVETTGSGFIGSGSGAPVTGLFDEEEWGMVSNFEASLGLDVYLSENATLTVGGRVESVNVLSDFSTTGISGSGGAVSNNRLSFGPTIKLTAGF